MSDFEEQETLLSEWLQPITLLTPEEFCSRWVPIIYQLSPDRRNLYRKACYHLLARTNRCSMRTAKNWLNYPESVPQYIPEKLGLLDLYWRIRQTVTSSIEHT